MLKVKFLSEHVRGRFLKIVGLLSTSMYMLIIFFDLPEFLKGFSGLSLLLLSLLIIYVIIWIHANRLSKVKISIGGTTVIIKEGDIFLEDGLKVIPFNEYFDTVVDDVIIAKKSLNGQYIERNFENIMILDDLIAQNGTLNSDDNIIDQNISKNGKSVKYKLGSSLVIDDYVLTAFTNFNSKNEASLSMVDYINFLINFWNEINRVYAQKSVIVPIFGSGITRFKGKFFDIEVDELLLIMLWTFRLSEVRFKYPAKLTIVIYKDHFNKIDLFKLKEVLN